MTDLHRDRERQEFRFYLSLWPADQASHRTIFAPDPPEAIADREPPTGLNTEGRKHMLLEFTHLPAS